MSRCCLARRPQSIARPRLVRGSADRIASVPVEKLGSSILVLDERFSTPVALFDVLDLLLAHAEVVPNFVNERFTDDRAHVIFVVAILFDGSLKQRDAVGKLIA